MKETIYISSATSVVKDPYHGNTKAHELKKVSVTFHHPYAGDVRLHLIFEENLSQVIDLTHKDALRLAIEILEKLKP